MSHSSFFLQKYTDIFHQKFQERLVSIWNKSYNCGIKILKLKVTTHVVGRFVLPMRLHCWLYQLLRLHYSSPKTDTRNITMKRKNKVKTWKLLHTTDTDSIAINLRCCPTPGKRSGLPLLINKLCEGNKAYHYH